jgi:hypothetical protein
VGVIGNLLRVGYLILVRWGPGAALPSLSSSYSDAQAHDGPKLRKSKEFVSGLDPTRTVWDFKIIADLDQQSK